MPLACKIILMLCLIKSLYAESLPSLEINNYQSSIAYIITSPEVVVGKDYEDACGHLAHLGYTWKIVPKTDVSPACYSPSNSKRMGADTWYCADGSLAYYNVPWWYCPSFRVCPNLSWAITSDRLNCTRPTETCSASPMNVSEIRLIAAIVNGEATPGGPYVEKAAIANALVRKSKAYGFATVNDFVTNKKTRLQISSLNPPNIRVHRALCSDLEIEYPEEYAAAVNALDEEGIDYANGACFWDGEDLEAKGTDHKHYKWGYMFTDPIHDVLGVGNTPEKNITTDRGHYNFTLESTAGYGHTVFWRYTSDWLNAMGGKQCR